MAEQADARDSNSREGDLLWVRFPPPASDLIAAFTGGVCALDAAFFIRALEAEPLSTCRFASIFNRGWGAQGLAGRIAIGAAAGLVLGLAIGWLWPVQYTNTAPSALRQDYRDDYIVMVTAAYKIEGDPDRARERLALLDAEEPVAPVIELAERLIDVGGSVDDITQLARLAWALKATTPALVPYLGEEP